MPRPLGSTTFLILFQSILDKSLRVLYDEANHQGRTSWI